MRERAEDKAFFCVVLHVSPTEYEAMTVREREAFLVIAKKNGIIK